MYIILKDLLSFSWHILNCIHFKGWFWSFLTYAHTMELSPQWGRQTNIFSPYHAVHSLSHTHLLNHPLPTQANHWHRFQAATSELAFSGILYKENQTVCIHCLPGPFHSAQKLWDPSMVLHAPAACSLAKQFSIVWLGHRVFSHSSVAGHFHCFQVWAITKKAPVNIHVSFFWVHICFLCSWINT